MKPCPQVPLRRGSLDEAYGELGLQSKRKRIMSILVRIIIISKNILNVETGLFIGFLSPT